MLENNQKQIGSFETNPEKDEPAIDVDILDLFQAIKKYFFSILAAGLAAGCLVGGITKVAVTPVYTSMSSLLVLSKETTLTSLADLQLGASLTSDYTVLIESSPVLEQVIENLSLDMDAESLRQCVTIENPSDTRILEIYAENSDPEMAKEIVDEIAEVSSAYIGDKMEVIPPKIIETGKIPTSRSSPNVVKNALFGLILGIAAATAIVMLHIILDDTIKTEEDINKYLGISVLANIPDRKDYITSKKQKNGKKRSH